MSVFEVGVPRTGIRYAILLTGKVHRNCPHQCRKVDLIDFEGDQHKRAQEEEVTDQDHDSLTSQVYCPLLPTKMTREHNVIVKLKCMARKSHWSVSKA